MNNVDMCEQHFWDLVNMETVLENVDTVNNSVNCGHLGV